MNVKIITGNQFYAGFYGELKERFFWLAFDGIKKLT
jgi:hypothetical protein